MSVLWRNARFIGVYNFEVQMDAIRSMFLREVTMNFMLGREELR